MNKSELIAFIAKNTKTPKTTTTEVVEAVFDVITGTLSAGGEVSIAGFRAFKVAARAAREGRNPLNGEKVKIAARTVAKFTPGKALKDSVNGPAQKKPAKKK